jgi:hypothetical protein
MRDFPPPDWVARVSPNELKRLLAKVDSDHSPLVPPREAGPWGLRTGRWKLYRVEGGDWALCDEDADPDCATDVSQTKRQVTRELVKLYSRFGPPDEE